MKKLLTSLLALLTCFACATAVACGESGNNNGSSNGGSSETTPPADDELQDAVDYLETLYKEQNVETRQDYEVLPAIMGYPITWTVDVASGVTINATADKVIVDVDELLDENLTYVLTATVADGDRTITVSFTRVVLAAPAIIPVAITEAPQAGVAYKYHVYQSTLAQDMYFAGGMAATYYFSTTTNWEEGVDVYAEYVEGSTTDFYLYFVSEGVNQYLGVKVSADGAHDNIIYGTEKVSTFVWNADLGTVTTHLEATKNNGGPNDFYFGNYGDKTTISCSYTSFAGGDGNNVGHLVTMVDRNSITPEVKVAESKTGLALSKTEFVGAAEVELPVARHADVAVEWAITENANASLVDGKLVLTNPAEDTTVTLTATLTCGEVTDTKEFTITLKHATEGPITTIAGALAGAEGAEATFSGTVSKIYQAWSDQYSNISFYVTDGTDTILVFRAGTKVEVGDEVTVTGNVTAYNGVNQIAAGASVTITGSGSGTDTPVETPTLTAVVPEVDKPYLFGMTQANLENAVYYLAGGMDGYYMATTTDATAAIDTYIEATTGGYYFYTYVDGVKTYINMVVSGTHVNGAYEATASTVYTIDETNKTLIAVVNDADYWFGTRNDKTYTTMGPCAVSYAGFFGVFYAEGEGSGSTDTPVVTPPVETPTLTAVVPEVDKPYLFGMTQANLENAVYYLAGGMDGYYMATTTDASAAIDTYIEATTGGYYFYTYVDGVKTYINMVVSGTHVNGAYEATASTVYTIDETNKTLIAVVNDADYWFGTRNDKTYTTMGPCAVSYAGFFGVFYAEGEGSGSTDTPVVTPPTTAHTTIAGALAGAEGDTATFSGTVSEIYQAWDSYYGNMSFYVTDGTDRILVFRAGTQVEIGDAVTVDGTVTMYNEKPQIAQGATVTVTEKHVCSTFTEADCLNAAKCTVCDKVNGEALGHKDENSDNVCDTCNGNLATATVKASKTIADLIVSEGWTSSTTKQEFALDDVVTVKVNGGNNSGKAYNGDHIRIYATDSPAGTLTISVADGYELVSIKVTTSTGTYAFLCVDGSDVDISNVQTAVSGASVVLNSVKNGSDGKQVRVLAIEVEYKSLG